MCLAPPFSACVLRHTKRELGVVVLLLFASLACVCECAHWP